MELKALIGMELIQILSSFHRLYLMECLTMVNLNWTLGKYTIDFGRVQTRGK